MADSVLTLDEEDDSPWRPLVTEHHYVLTVLSLSAAVQAGYHLARTAVLLAIAAPDEGAPTPINFESITSLKTFITECAPREIFYKCAPGENMAIVRMLLEDRGTLH